MAADGEFAQFGFVYRSSRSRVEHLHATQVLSRARRWIIFLALALVHLVLLWMLRIGMAPRLPQFADALRIEVEFLSESAPVPPLAPPAAMSTAHSEPSKAPLRRTVQAARVSSPARTGDEPARPRLFRPDGGLVVSDDLLDRLDSAGDRAVEFRIANLDKAGTFLRPPPIDYTPTRFDAYWMPSETLFDEWVRKGFQEVSIPIPGSSWRIVCKVSLLAPGGGCGIAPVVQGTNPIELAPYVPPPNRNR